MNPVWILDLDNTLYPADSGLFAEVDQRIRRFMEERLGIPPERIPALRMRYRETYGVTLGGLMAHHGVDPREYLDYVHDVPLDRYLAPDPELDRVLGRLAGRKVVFTNGSSDHAWRVLRRLGVAGRIQGVYDIIFMDYVPKPRPHGYRKLLKALSVPPATCWMVDDLPENLETARALGVRTVLVGPRPVPPHLHVSSFKELPARLDGACPAASTPGC